MHYALRITNCALFFTFAGIFFVRTILMPLAYDDYAYAFIWDGAHDGNLQMMMIGSPEVETRQRVDSFGDIFDSMWSHYFTWGGRIFAHSLVQFFMWIGKPAFDVANTLIFIALVLSIIKLAAAQVKLSRNVLLWIFFSLFILSVWSMTTMFWLTGSCNYMWMSLVQLIFLIPYVNALRLNNSPQKFWLIIPLGLMAGLVERSGRISDNLFDNVLDKTLQDAENLSGVDDGGANRNGNRLRGHDVFAGKFGAHGIFSPAFSLQLGSFP